ncbi:MAG: RsmE family RNA methyltransferase [Candidatus Omnitrophica bacterium]|nr:RsmE family RNA methyltransferase [Candidatus Omnitrophota bacterium]
MNRFFSSIKNISHDKILINDGEQVHHIKDVLRMKEKEKIAVFDENGNEYLSEISEITENGISANILQRKSSKLNKNEIKLTVACAIPKKSKIDDIIDKLTQLRVERIIPLETERVIIKIDKSKSQMRHKRWEKIALSAAKQSQRTSIPVVDPVTTFDGLLKISANFEVKLIPNLCSECKTLKEAVKCAQGKSVLVLIGPEGDFSKEEVKKAKSFGFIPVSLGGSVLRVETAAVAAASFIKLYEDN